MKCPDCGGPTIPLLSSRVCEAECDLDRPTVTATTATQWYVTLFSSMQLRSGDCVPGPKLLRNYVPRLGYCDVFKVVSASPAGPIEEGNGGIRQLHRDIVLGEHVLKPGT